MTNVYHQIKYFDWPIAETLSNLDRDKSLVFSSVYIGGGGTLFTNCRWMIIAQLKDEKNPY